MLSQRPRRIEINLSPEIAFRRSDSTDTEMHFNGILRQSPSLKRRDSDVGRKISIGIYRVRVLR
jgi:hypothetical protein